VPIGWMFVVVMMSAAEAMSPQGTVLGAIVTFVLYGLLPLSIVVYVMGTPMRRRKRLAEESLEAAAVAPTASPSAGLAPDGSSLAAGDAGPAERKEV
jgi:hypothetical protein